MSKRDIDGDVLANKLAIGEAKGRSFLASILGPPAPESSDNATKVQDEENDDLKQNYSHDRLGVGGIMPKDVADGSFTKRAPTSNDKLLEQLLGKKKAKAHLAAKQEAAGPNAKTQRQARPAAQKKEESEDEEEGRAGAFQSKRSKKSKPKVTTIRESDSDNEDEETRAARLEKSSGKDDEVVAQTEDVKAPEYIKLTLDTPEQAATEAPAPKKGKTKHKSFLDEILAERSKKKKRG